MLFYSLDDKTQEKVAGKTKKSLKLASPISFYYLCGVSS